MKNIKIIAIFLMSFTPLFAQDFTLLDKAVSEGDCDKVLSLLDSQTGDTSSFEERILDKAESLVMQSDYDLAMELTETVLLFNMDNQRAQEMYTSIEQAKKDKIKEEKEALIAEEQKKAELKAQKLADYRLSVKEYYRTLSKVSYRNFPLEAGLTLASAGFASSDFAFSETALRYGFGGELKASFVHPGIRFDFDFDYVYSPLQFTGEGNKREFNMRTSVTSPVFPIPFALSAGYKKRVLTGDSSLYDSLAFPVIGAGLSGFEIIPDFLMTAFVDLDLSSFAADSMIDFALGGELSLKYIFRLKPLVGIYVEERNRFDFFVLDSASESYFDAALSVGVILNER